MFVIVLDSWKQYNNFNIHLTQTNNGLSDTHKKIIISFLDNGSIV